MKNVRIALPFLLALAITGCNPARQASRSHEHVPVPTESDMPRVVLYPKGYEGIEAGPYTDAAADADVLAGVLFSGLECEHVRVKGVNPLPATGRLEVDLDKLGDVFVYPCKGKFLSDYGMRDGRPHTGIDIKTIPDDTIRAVLPGVVRMSKNYSSYGNIVVIRHPQGFETVYAHCSRNLVSVNDRVEAGTPVGLAGRTGRATTEHLHFEVRVAGDPVDPKKLVDVTAQKLRPGMFYAESNNGTVVAYNDYRDLQDIKDNIAEAEKFAAEAVRPEPPKPSAQAQASAGSGEVRHHTVVKGDTLYAISRKYSTTVKELCRLNNIKETAILSLGQKIRVK